MNVFELRERLVADYRDHTRSFIKIRVPRIKEFVDGHLGTEGFWPEPLLQLNPAFQPAGKLARRSHLTVRTVSHDDTGTAGRRDSACDKKTNTHARSR